MSSHFLPAGCLMFLCTLIALGATTAEAADIGVHLRVHAQNVPGAVAGDTARMPACLRGSGRADAIATESEHKKHSAGRSGRKYGDQIAQMSD
jgi:hypothetical protein